MIKYCIALVLLVGCGSKTPSFESKEALTQEILAAISQKDTERYMEAIHPDCRKHINNENIAFFKEIINRSFDINMANIDNISYSTGPSDLKLMFPDKFDYPVKPAAIAKIEYSKSQYSSGTLIWWFSKYGSSWHLVYGIPTSETMSDIVVRQTRQAEMELEIENHLANMEIELYEKIKKILKEKKSLIEAHKVHMEATQTDKTFSVTAVKRIRSKENLEW